MCVVYWWVCFALCWARILFGGERRVDHHLEYDDWFLSRWKRLQRRYTKEHNNKAEVTGEESVDFNVEISKESVSIDLY